MDAPKSDNIKHKSDNIKVFAKQNTNTIGSVLVKLKNCFIQLFIVLLFYFGEASQWFKERITYKKEKDVRTKSVLITGAGGFLGRKLALEMAQRGAKLILWDNNAEENQKTNDEVKAQNPNTVVSVHTVDIGDEMSVRNTAANVKEQAGAEPVYMVIMAASPKIHPKPIMETQTSDVENSFRVDYLSQVWLMQEFIPSMCNLNKGHFVTISSAAAVFDIPFLSTYSSSKIAQAKLMETMREELRANGISGVNTSVVYCQMLNDGQMSEEMDAVFTFDRLGVLELTPKEAAEKIVSSILKNSDIIYVTNLIGVLMSIKCVLSPRIVSLLHNSQVHVNDKSPMLTLKKYTHKKQI